MAPLPKMPVRPGRAAAGLRRKPTTAPGQPAVVCCVGDHCHEPPGDGKRGGEGGEEEEGADKGEGEAEAEEMGVAVRRAPSHRRWQRMASLEDG